MDLKGRFASAWFEVKDNPRFVACAEKYLIEREEQKYIIAAAVGRDNTDVEICEAIDIKYNFRPHRRYKKNRNEHLHDELTSITNELLTIDVDVGKSLKVPEKTQKRDITAVLNGIIYGDVKANEKVKAIESLMKIEDKRQGSQALEPWERLWNETIIPNMMSHK